MALKLILLVAVVMIVLQWRRKLQVLAGRARATSADRTAEPVEMLACAECGVHLPRSEAVIADGAGGPVYCCDAHRAMHRAPPQRRDRR